MSKSYFKVLLPVFLLSCSALAYEILLLRLFSIIQWHHFAYMVISLALLGYGLSGVVLAFLRERLLANFDIIFPISILLFIVTAPVCFWLAQQIPFNPAEIFWSPWQFAYLFCLYLLLMTPFFWAALAIGLTITQFRKAVSILYTMDLLGAGLGSVTVILILIWFTPEQALTIISIVPMAGLLAYVFFHKQSHVLRVFLVLGIVITLLVTASKQQALHISTYKELNQLLRIPEANVIDRFSGPMADVRFVSSGRIPLRHAPGLSLNATTEIPDQIALFTDADNLSAITRFDGNTESLAYLDQLTSALPFYLQKKADNLLILGAGSGSDVLQARYFGIKNIDAVELNGQLLAHLKADYNRFSGGIFDAADIQWHVGDARGFVSTSRHLYDQIQISLLDAFGASSAGLYALSENYLYTVEALQEYLTHLKPGGYLAITRWIKMPPRDTLKLLATAVSAMTNLEYHNPEQRLLMIRGWQTSTLLIKNGRVTAEEISIMKQFCEERSFDLDYYSGMKQQETNRFNILAEPYYYQAAHALLSKQANAFIDSYKFDIQPATDDRPYFFKFFKWRTLPEILSLFRHGGIPLLESGYILLITGTVQAFVAGFLFLVVPLIFQKKNLQTPIESNNTWRFMAFFLCLGLAFLFIEIAFIQKFILFLHHPIYSSAVMLTTFLVSAGIGSFISNSLAEKRYGHWYPILGLAGLAFLYLLLVNDLTEFLLGQPVWVNFTIAIFLTAPLGFFMGMPFPLGIGRINQINPLLIPWAWGINGFASVISAMLATLIAIHWGFNVLVLTAIGVYLLAGLILPTVPSSLTHPSGKKNFDTNCNR